MLTSSSAGDLVSQLGTLDALAARTNAAVSEVAADPHLAATGAFPELEHPTFGTFRTVALPMKLRGQDIGPRGPGPDLGQHTREVLTGLGLTGDEVDALVADGTVADGTAAKA